MHCYPDISERASEQAKRTKENPIKYLKYRTECGAAFRSHLKLNCEEHQRAQRAKSTHALFYPYNPPSTIRIASTVYIGYAPPKSMFNCSNVQTICTSERFVRSHTQTEKFTKISIFHHMSWNVHCTLLQTQTHSDGSSSSQQPHNAMPSDTMCTAGTYVTVFCIFIRTSSHTHRIPIHSQNIKF